MIEKGSLKIQKIKTEDNPTDHLEGVIFGQGKNYEVVTSKL